MLSLINNDQHGTINATEYELTKGSSAGDKDAISKRKIIHLLLFYVSFMKQQLTSPAVHLGNKFPY